MAENIKQLSNAFSLGGGLNINSNQPIDSRFKVQSLVELTYDWKNKNNGGEISKYEGLLTYVEEVGKTFRYRTGASYTQGETTIANWELVPVSADDINSLVEIPEVDIQSISVNGETVTPIDGNVNIIIPEVVYPEYELVAGDTNSVKLLKDGEAAGEVSISLKADVVKSDDPNVESAESLAIEKNIGKIILVSGEPEGSEYLNGTYIIDGVGSVKYLATTTGTVDDGDVDAKINSAIDSLDSTISANANEYLTSITIENGKLVSSTSAPAPEAPEYTIFKTTNDTSTEYKLQKDGVDVAETIIVPKSEIINKVTVDNSTTYEIEGEAIVMQETLDANYKIKDIIDTDKILNVDYLTGKLSSTISLKHGTITEEVDGETVTYPTIELIGKGEQLISYIGVSDFIKDGFLISASYNEETYQLTLTWNTDSGVETTNIDLTDLVHGLESESEATDLVKIEISNNSATKPENEPFKYIVSIDETNLQNKLDEIDGAFIKSVVDNDTATYVKVNAETDAQVVTISVDETKLGEKITDVEGRITELENAEDVDTKCESATINAGTTAELTEGEVAVLSNTTITLSGDGTSLSGTATAVNVVTKQYVTGIETSLDERITALENEVDDDTKCESATINAGIPAEVATEGEVTVLSNATITLSGDGTSLSGTATAVNVVTKQYVDGRFDSLVDNDTKCESATINAGTPAEAATEGEVTVLSNTNITLSGDGTSLTGTATAVNVVTKQYVDSKFDEVPTFEAITTSEIDGIFTQG